jgi:hypothetical protein
MIGQLSAVPRSGCNWVLTHRGVFACSIHSGALVPRRSTIAGVPGPRRNADDRDAGWFAPVATRRRPIFAALCAASRLARSAFPGGRPPGPPARLPHRWRGSPLALFWLGAGLAVGVVPSVGGARRWPCSGWGRGSPLGLFPVWAGLAGGLVLAVGRVRRGPCSGWGRGLAWGLFLPLLGLGGGGGWLGLGWLMSQVIRRVGFAGVENLCFGLAGEAWREM